MHKTYRKQNGKTFGPYYYATIRTRDGKTKSIYLGKNRSEALDNQAKLTHVRNEEKARKKWRFRIPATVLLVMLLVSLIPGLTTAGYILLTDFPNLTLNGTDAVPSSENVTIENMTEDVTPPFLPVMNDTGEVGENLTEHNLTESNLTERQMPEENVTISANATEEELNATIGNITSGDGGLNATADNITLNLTENLTANLTENITLGIEGNITSNTNDTNTNITIIGEETHQFPAVIGKPVKWLKKLRLSGKTHNFSMKLPEYAENLSVNGIENGSKKDIRNLKIKRHVGQKRDISAIMSAESPEEEDVLKEIEIETEEEIDGVEIEYYTPAPESLEEEIGPYKKMITISSETHYEDILAFTNLSVEAPTDSVHLYWLQNDSRTEVPAEKHDTNGNGLVDYVEWTVPSLSNQTYELEITILNVQSYPTVGGKWTVAFTTTGTANLTITAVNDTTYGTEPPEDLEFLELRCGANTLSPDFDGSLIFYENYECNETGYHTVKVLTEGTHMQEFDFGGLKAYASNWATVSASDTNLTIWDDSDTQATWANSTKFYANYTNMTSNETTNGSGIWCEFRHNKTGIWQSLGNMSYNATSMLYEFYGDCGYLTGHSCIPVGNYSFNVSCFDSNGTYQNVSSADLVSISDYATFLNVTNTGETILQGSSFNVYANFTKNGSFGVTGISSEIGQVVGNTTDVGAWGYAARFFDGNGSGKRDYVAAATNAYTLSAYYGNGTQKWTVTNATWLPFVVTQVLTFDPDEDNTEEVLIAGSNSGPSVVKSGTLNFTSDLLTGTGEVAVIAIGDFDGDGKRDDFVADNATDTFVYIFNGTTWDLNWTANHGGTGVEIAVTDVNDDGIEDVFVAAYNDGVYAYYGNNGTLMWSNDLGDYQNTISALDANGDGKKNEFVVSENGDLFWINSTGVSYQNSTVPIGIMHESRVMDIDNDGKEDDVVVGDQIYEASVIIRAFNDTANSLWNYTTSEIAPTSNSPYAYNIWAEDVNGDGSKEIIFSVDISSVVKDPLYVLNRTGSLLWKSNISLAQIGYATAKSPGVHSGGDVNHDGLPDISVIYGSSAVDYLFILQDVSCTAYFNDSTSYAMSWNYSTRRWELNQTKTFNTNGTYSYNVTCQKNGYQAQAFYSSTDITVQQVCDEGDTATTCNITSRHNLSDGAIFNANNLIIKSGGSLVNDTANCTNSTGDYTSHGCGFQIRLTGNLTIIPGGNITAGNISITASNVDVQANSTATGKIVTDGLGWMGGGKGSGNSSEYQVGACYGGLGAKRFNWSSCIYGSAESPADFGSGYYTSTSGGGIVFINATGNISVNGAISSAGSAYSSGGSIWLIASIFDGTGNISANTSSTGGGGGRIRTTYATNSFTGIISALGYHSGTYSFSDGNNLTVKANISLAGGNYTIPYLNVTNGATLEVQPNTSFSGNGAGVQINAVNVYVDSGAKISADEMGFGSYSGPGYLSGTYQGYGSTHGGRGGRNTNNVYGSETQPTSLGSGANYYYGGGRPIGGGAIFINATGNVTLNGLLSAEAKNSGCNSGPSGGSVYVIADNLTINSNLSARGGLSTSCGDGGGGGRIALYANYIYFYGTMNNEGGIPYGASKWGSGGTIYINATTSITSSGNISVVGYNGSTGGADWGQRINMTAPLLTLSGIYNASRINDSVSGTVDGQITLSTTDYCTGLDLAGATFQPAYTPGGTCTLCDQGNVDTTCNITTRHNISDSYIIRASSIIIKSGGSLVNDTANCTNSTGENMSHGCGFQIRLTGNLTIMPGGNITAGNISITASNVDVQANSTATGKIVTDGLGWMAYSGPGYLGSGAGIYGGISSGGSTYGNASAPTDFGSGGEPFGSALAGGGGIIFINASENLNISGILSSNGQTGFYGGASGGSIWVISNILSGDGNVSSNGGGASDGGKGSGGRIRTTYSTNNFNGIISVSGVVTSVGAGGLTGHHGTYSFPDGNNLTVKANMALAGGNYTIPYLNITNNATLEVQPLNASASDNGTGVVINCVNVNIDSGASISGDGMGFKPQKGPGYQAGSHGGTHAGTGGSNTLSNYGSDIWPTALGSGGNNANYDDMGHGGGAIFLNCTGNITTNGNLTARGLYGYYGSGAGGSILIVANNISGNGYISASGPGSGNWGGGGGGGRIALHASNIIHSIIVESNGGTASDSDPGPGSAGTIFINASTSITSTGNITTTGYNGTTAKINITSTYMRLSGIYNASGNVSNGTITLSTTDYCTGLDLAGSTFQPAYTPGGTCTLCDQGNVDTTCNVTTRHNISDLYIIRASNIIIKSGGSLVNDTANCTNSIGDYTSHGCGFQIRLTGNLTIQSGGNITAGNISIRASNVDVQAGGKIVTDGLGWMSSMGPSPGAYNNGASYGGVGGGGDITKKYGSATSPVDFGSGGSYPGGDISPGGGIIFVNASNNINITGNLTANGLSGNGGASGGSIWLIASSISGNGFIKSEGGAKTYTTGGGGGGRISINATYNFAGNISAKGGSDGKAGTLMLPSLANLIVNYDVGLEAGNYSFGNLTIGNNAKLLMYGVNTSSTEGYGVQLSAESITINSGSAISADGIGFPWKTGPGGGTYFDAGAHGGKGGANTDAVYGSETQPITLGSGAYSASGGGAIKLNVTNYILVDGNISANGDDNYYSCGAGGSVWIVANNISGTGVINANGGVGGTNQFGAGGGGRIALQSNTINLLGLIENKGGIDTSYISNSGSAGTIFINATTSITSTGNITATGYNGTTAGINMTAPLLTLSGIYNASRYNSSVAGTVDGRITLSTTDYCTGLDLVGSTFQPAYTPGGTCTLCDQGNVDTTCNITTRHNISDSYIIRASIIIIKSGGSLVNDTANCTNSIGDYTSHGCGFSIKLTGNLTIQNGGNVTAGNISIAAYHVDLQSGAKVWAFGLGYMSGNGPGSNPGINLPASYGGLGGSITNLSKIYGSTAQPADFGSGGVYTGTGGGGGIIFINATGNVTLNGNVSSKATDMGTDYCGHSGGSIWIISSNLSGNGSIDARGGNSGTYSSGGGGRVRITYSASNFTGIVDISAGNTAATVGTRGRPGTFSFPDGDNLTVRADFALVPGTYNIPVLNVTNGVVLDIQQNYSSSTAETITRINSSSIFVNGSIYAPDSNCSGTDHGCSIALSLIGNLTIMNAGNITAGNISITASNVEVQSGGRIMADGFGWMGGKGPGYTGTYSNTTHCTYDSEAQPAQFGSGGRSVRGGGVIFVNATGNLNISGNISAKGVAGGSGGYSGSTGGSIWLIANNAIITGWVSVNGGASGSLSSGMGGGGGSGRLALYSATLTHSGIIENNGGNGAYWNENYYYPGSGCTTYINATNITSTGNITSSGGIGNASGTGFGGNISMVSGILTLSGTYNATTPGGINYTGTSGKITLNYTDCANSVISGTFQPAATGAGACAAGTNVWNCSSWQNWSNSTCWTLGHVPCYMDNVIINASGTGNINITNNTLAQYINSFTVASNYPGKIYFLPLFAVGSWGIWQGSQEWNVTNNINISNGTIYVYGDAYDSKNITYDGRGQVWKSVSGNITIGTNAVIDGTGLGFPNWTGPGISTAQYDSASHGGYSGDEYMPYGNASAPLELGSGGSDSGTPIPNGGSAIKLDASSGTITIDGSIMMNGTGWRRGSAGGSIWLRANNLSGSGRVEATSGTEDAWNGGGGGRIRFDFNSYSYNGVINVNGGSGITSEGGPGRPGTFSWKPSLTGGENLTWPGSWTLNGTIGLEAGNYTILGNLVIPSGITLGIHPLNATASATAGGNQGAGVVINVTGNITIEAGVTIDGIKEGFLPSYGPGTGGAGTHGGRGYGNSVSTYGSETYPTSLGSGGTSSFGGGAIRLISSGNIIVNGTIDVRGTAYNYGSAGGSILLEAQGSVLGNGNLTALGVYGNSYGGGGGRIALHANTVDFSGIINNEGSGSGYGSGGTVFINATTSITHSGNISVVGYNGSTGGADWGQRINMTAPLLTLSGIYNASRINSSVAGTVDGRITLSYTNCAQSVITGTFQPSATTTGACAAGTNVWNCSSWQNWSNASCWSLGHVPCYGDNVTINGTGNGNINITQNSMAQYINSITVASTYAGKVHALPLFAVGSRGSYLGSQQVNITGNINISGGTLYIYGDYVNTTCCNLTSEGAGQTWRSMSGNITIGTNGIIDGTGLGFLEKSGPGSGWEWLGPSHGGYGSTNQYYLKLPYGNATAPTSLGSGGDNGGRGGSALKLDAADKIQIDGKINISGLSGYSGGAGGSIWLKAGNITGYGALNANGGNGLSSRQAGGGGRIRFDFSYLSFRGNLTASGGTAPKDAKPGTFSFTNNTYPSDWIVNGTIGLAAGNYTILGNLTIPNRTILTVHPLNATASDQGAGVFINVTGNITIDTLGAIDGEGEGFYTAQGTGAGGEYTGGTHGGKGRSNSKATYGSEAWPESLGSGAGSISDSGSACMGGGAVRLDASQNIIINGNISVVGYSRNCGDSAGAGGSIWLKADNISGRGSMIADGGSTASTWQSKWGGGGGRIALHANTINLSGLVTNMGGNSSGGYTGSAGSIFINSTAYFISTGNITAAGFNGTDAVINITSPVLTLSGIYNASSNITPQGLIRLVYTNCLGSRIAGTYDPLPTDAGVCGYTFVSACGVLNSSGARYRPVNDVNSSATCFNITADNITLECAGFGVNHSSGNSGYGVITKDTRNVTVKNCVINDSGTYSSDSRYGIYYYNSTNGTIENNTVSTEGYNSHAIRLYYYSSNNTVRNNTVTGLGSGASGISISDLSRDNILRNNTVIKPPAGGTGMSYYVSRGYTTSTNSYIQDIDTTNIAGGKPVKYYNAEANITIENNDSLGELIVANSNNITIRNLTMTVNGIEILGGSNVSVLDSNFSYTQQGAIFEMSANATVKNNKMKISGGIGIYSSWNCPYFFVTNNTIDTSSGSPAIYTRHDYSYIENNTVNSTDGVCIDLESSHSTIQNNNMLASATYENGLKLEGSSLHNVSVLNNTINITGSMYSSGIVIDIYTMGYDLRFENVSVYTSCAQGCYAFYIIDDNVSFTMNDSVLGANQSADFFVPDEVTAGSFNFSNVTYDNITFEPGANGTLYVSWYLNANVSNSRGNPVSAANVSSWDRDGRLWYSSLTDAQGLFKGYPVLERTTNSTGTAYFTPYTVNVTKAGYSRYSNASVNFTANHMLNASVGAGTNYWVCPSAQNFSNATCWSQGRAPYSGDSVVFNGSGTGNCNITNNTMPQYLDSFTVQPDYTGRISFSTLFGYGGWGGLEIDPAKETGLVGLWHLNREAMWGETDTHVHDYSGSENNGSAVNANRTSDGKLSGAFRFNSSDSEYISIPDSVSLNITTGNFTVAFWGRKADASQILTVGKGNPGNTNGRGWGIYASSDNVYFYFNNGTMSGGVSSYNRYPASQTANAEWHHYIGVGINDETNWSLSRMYVDGAEITADSRNSCNGSIANSLPFRIGQAVQTNAAYTNGTLDEVAIWNRALSAEEALAVYSRQVPYSGTQEWNVTNDVNISGGILYVYGDCHTNASVTDYCRNITYEGHGQIWRSLNGSITVGSQARLDGVGIGFPAEFGPGYDSHDNGATHGGYGGDYNYLDIFNYYGNASAPTSLGTGSGNGGGSAIELEAVTGAIRVDGVINMSASRGYWAGAAGGSVWLRARNITGGGYVVADGADSGGAGRSGGGGGRIRFDFESYTYSGMISAAGGKRGSTSYNNGKPGTFSFTNNTYPGDWTLNGSIGLPGGNFTVLGNLVIPNGTVLEVHAANDTLTNLTGGPAGAGVAINATGNITLEATAVIDGNREGFRPKYGPAGSDGWDGGAHGGKGGGSNNDPAYDSEAEPLGLGSGGGGSYGGGAVKLETTQNIQADGNITVEGKFGYWDGGAGGSIWLKAGTITGSGNIIANGGGTDYVSGGGGGGGRIALHAGTINFTGNMSSNGGLDTSFRNYDGGGGTVYINATSLIRISGNITATGFIGGNITIRDTLIQLFGVYNASTVNGSAGSNGRIVLNYTDCSCSLTSATYSPTAIYQTTCPPAVAIILPVNASNFDTNQSIALNYTASDEGLLDSCWWTIDSNATKNIVAGCANTTLSVSQGTHLLVLHANDTTNNENSANVSLHADSVYPALSYIYPSPTQGQIIGTSSPILNSSVSDASDTYAFFDDSLVLWMRMDDTNSTGHPMDISRYGRNGTKAGNATQTYAGKFGRGFSFDGDGDYVEIPYVSGIGFNSNYTISLWFYSSAAAPGILANIANNTNDRNGILFFTNQIRAGYYNGSAYVGKSISASINTWYHVVLVNANGNVSLFVNGSTQANGTMMTDLSDVNRIGDSNAATYFNGTIDEVLIFDRSLSATEILALYNSSNYTLQRQLSGLPELVHNYTARFADRGGNRNSSGLSFEVDLTKPGIQFVYPTPDNNTGRTQKFEMNVSIREKNLANVTFAWNGTDYTVYSPKELGNGLVLMLNFDNESAYGENETLVYDFSGNGNNGTLYGNASINLSGSYGSAAQFDGDGDYIYAASDSSKLNYTSNFTISAWVYPSGTGLTGDAGLVGRWNGNGYMLYGDQQAKLFRFYCGATASTFTYSSFNQWYHLVGVKNDTGTYLYVNGTLRDNDAVSSCTTNSVIFGLSFYNSGGQRAFNGTIDEVMLWNRSLSPGEVSQLYYSKLRKYADLNEYAVEYSKDNTTALLKSSDALNENWTLEINQSGLVLGKSYTYYVTARDMPENSNSTETRTVKGNSLAGFASVTHSPSGLDDLDPNVTITVTANISKTDLNMDTAILQWKNATTEEWQNVTMNNLTPKGLYTMMNASFTPEAESNYSYRIWANDTEGDSNTSWVTNVSVFWDCTWVIDPAYLGETAGWDENKEIGNITINNTGDPEYAVSACSLDFRLTYDLTEGRIYFDNVYYKPSAVYTITAGSNRTIMVNATFLPEVKEEIPIITVNDVSSRSNTTNRNATATVISASGGPYLYQRISDSPASIYLTPQDFSLAAYVRNMLGDGSAGKAAYNVSFSWSLPSGLSLKDGTTDNPFENISDNTPHYSYLNVSVNSSGLGGMSPGTTKVYIYAQGYNASGILIMHANNATLLTDSVDIALLCYSIPDGIYVTACGVSDGDYVEPEPHVVTIQTGGTSFAGPSAAAGITPEQKEKLFQTEETYEMVRGEQQNFTLKVENPFEGALENVQVSISGFLAKYLRVEPPSTKRIPVNGSFNFTIWIESPKYFTKGVYSLNFTITGVINTTRRSGNYTFGTTTTIRESRLVTLIIHEISREAALKYLNMSREIVDNLTVAGLASGRLNDLISREQRNIDIKEYGEVKVIYDTINEIRDKALRTLGLFDEMKAKADEAAYNGLAIPKTRRLILLSKAALARGDYDTALKRAEDAKVTYALETVGAFNAFAFIKNNWWQLSTASICIIFASYFALLSFRMNLTNRRLKSLRKEEGVLLDLMKELQRECFERGKLSMKEYMESLLQYEKRMSKVVQQTIRQETIRSNLFKVFKGRDKRLHEEREKIISLIKETQVLYLKYGKLETRIYNNRMKSYLERLAVIEEKLAVIEARKVMKEQR